MTAAIAAPIGKVVFDAAPDTANFSGNCKVITTSLNKLMAYAASTCQAKGGIVMLRATKAVLDRKQLPGFTALAFGSAGWAVSEDYYGEGAKFVVKNPSASGHCLMLEGSVAAYIQQQIKTEGHDAQAELLRAISSAHEVECPGFLA
jgi:hypothetical protein